MLDQPAPKPDPDAAVAFLEALRPGGPWNVTAIVPDGPISSATFTDHDEARAWIARHADRANLHFVPNPAPAPSGKGGRVRKDDVPTIEYLHGDYDVDKIAKGQDLDGLSLPQRKAAVEDDMAFSGLTPAMLIDSGGGLQGLWKLAEPLPATPENIEWAEGANRWLAGKFAGGEPECANIDHLLRLPGTLNFPNEKKRKRGRTLVATRLVSSTGELHDRAAFGQVAAPSKLAADIDLGVPELVTDLDALAAEYGLPERLVTIIRDGRLPEPKHGDDSRSAWLFDATCGLARHGVPGEVIAGVLLNSEWGISASIYDHPGRQPEEQAVREAARALAAMEAERQSDMDQMAAHAVEPDAIADTETETDTDPGLTLIRASDVKPEPLTPLWPGRVYLGKLTTFAGNPGEGKSQVTVDMCARISTGADWPDGSGPAPRGDAIIIAAEDEPGDTIIPRLMAAGADMSRIGILDPTIKPKKGDKGGTRMIDIGKDLARIDRLIRRRHPDTRVVILDTINSFLGGADNYRDTEVRNVLGPFKEWCERRKIAGIIVTHFRKDGGNGGGGNAMSRIMGSTAFAGLARSVWAFIPEPSAGEPTGRNVMAVVKQNVTAKQDALAFRFVGVDVAEGINAPRVEWDGFVAGTADDLLRAADRGASGTKSKPPSMTQACQVFLLHELTPGPRPATEVMEAGLKANYTRSMINDAKKASGIESFKEDGDKRWWWRLPQIEPETEDRT